LDDVGEVHVASNKHGEPASDVRHDARERGDPSFSRRQLLLGGVAVATASLASACGGGGSSRTSSLLTSSVPTAAGTARKGGHLRAGISGGSSKDTLDPKYPIQQIDLARVANLYDPLTAFSPEYKLEMQLAEAFEPNRTADVWTVRLRDGVEFHNGKTLTADDLIYTFQRILDKSSPGVAAAQLSIVDLVGTRKLDSRTVRIKLNKPNAILPEVVTFAVRIVPTGFDPRSPVGTGPFKYKSFTPGEQSVFERYDNYWGDAAFVDDLVIIDLTDDTARVNALLGGQVDVIDSVPYAQARVVKGTPGFSLLVSKTGAWRVFGMRVDVAPFNDVRVRQAMRLALDRDQMIAQALAGEAVPGNDVFGIYDPCYNGELPQHRHDPEQARALLRQAGHDGLNIKLTTAPVAVGIVEAAQVFAKQAQSAGIHISIERVDEGVLYGDQYLTWHFFGDYGSTHPYLVQAGLSLLPTAVYNYTHWKDVEWFRLYNQAIAQTDDSRRCSIVAEMQNIDHDRGGDIIWSFINVVDGLSSKVGGFVPDKTGESLTSFQFRRAFFKT
jgi:peptide/nickel transport system substrate-binding protein